MLTAQLTKLLSLAGEPLSTSPPRLVEPLRDLAGSLGSELLRLLGAKNGFFAFESALRVFPATSGGSTLGLDQWNSPDLWRHDYGALAEGCLFFAEDLVGGQFCVFSNSIHRFDSETGEKTPLADSFEGWAAALLEDHRVLTMWPLGHEWQQTHGALPAVKRLAPKTPFVLGGEFSVSNLYLAEPVKLMRFYANLAVQLQDLPDGARVELKAID